MPTLVVKSLVTFLSSQNEHYLAATDWRYYRD